MFVYVWSALSEYWMLVTLFSTWYSSIVSWLVLLFTFDKLLWPNVILDILYVLVYIVKFYYFYFNIEFFHTKFEVLCFSASVFNFIFKFDTEFYIFKTRNSERMQIKLEILRKFILICAARNWLLLFCS